MFSFGSMFGSSKSCPTPGMHLVQNCQFQHTSDLHPDILLDQNNLHNLVGNLYAPLFNTVLRTSLNPLYSEQEQTIASEETVRNVLEQKIMERVYLNDQILPSVSEFSLLHEQIKKIPNEAQTAFIEQWISMRSSFPITTWLFILYNLSHRGLHHFLEKFSNPSFIDQAQTLSVQNENVFALEIPQATLHLYTNAQKNLSACEIRMQSNFFAQDKQRQKSACVQIFKFELQDIEGWLRPSKVQFITGCDHPMIEKTLQIIHRTVVSAYPNAARKPILPSGYVRDSGRALEGYTFTQTSQLHSNILLTGDCAALFNTPVNLERDPLYHSDAINKLRGIKPRDPGEQELFTYSQMVAHYQFNALKQIYLNLPRDLPHNILMINNQPIQHHRVFRQKMTDIVGGIEECSLGTNDSERFAQSSQKLLQSPPVGVPPATWAFINALFKQRSLRGFFAKTTMVSIMDLDFFLLRPKVNLYIYLDSANNLQSFAIRSVSTQSEDSAGNPLKENIEVLAFDIKTEALQGGTYIRPYNVQYKTGCSDKLLHNAFLQIHGALSTKYSVQGATPLIMPHFTDPFFEAEARAVSARYIPPAPSMAAPKQPTPLLSPASSFSAAAGGHFPSPPASPFP